MRKYLLIYLIFCFTNCFGRTKIEITVTGSGESIEIAKNSALRTALEQVSGVYFSAYTEIINNVVNRNEMSSITNGSILNYKILTKANLNGIYYLTIKATISPNELIEYVRIKSNTTINIDGELYVANLKQKELDQKAELLALQNLYKICQQEIKKVYKYKLKASRPVTQSYGDEKNIEVEVDIYFKLSSKYNKLRKYLLSSVKNIALKKRDVDEYISLTGEQVYENEIPKSNIFQIFLLLSDLSVEENYLFTRNAIELPADEVFNFEINDGYRIWKPIGFKGWRNESGDIIHGQLEKVGELDAILSWPLPTSGESNKISLVFNYTVEEFSRVKQFSLIR